MKQSQHIFTPGQGNLSDLSQATVATRGAIKMAQHCSQPSRQLHLRTTTPQAFTVFNIQHVIVPFSEYSTIMKSFYSLESFTDSLVFPGFPSVPTAPRHNCWIKTPHTTEYCSHVHVHVMCLFRQSQYWLHWLRFPSEVCLFWNRQRWGLFVVDSWHLSLSSAFVAFHSPCWFLMKTHQVNTQRQWLLIELVMLGQHVTLEKNINLIFAVLSINAMLMQYKHCC